MRLWIVLAGADEGVWFIRILGKDMIPFRR